MISKPGESAVVRLAADANVLLSAAAHPAAARVFDAPVEVLTTERVMRDVRDYAPEFAGAYELEVLLLERNLETFALKGLPRGVYESRISEAFRRIGARDPDDVELLALAIALRIPVWSNDNVFRRARHEWYTTARLLAKLGFRGK